MKAVFIGLVAGLLGTSAVGAEHRDDRFQHGAARYREACLWCHNEAGSGTRMLGRRLGEARARLETRDDLQPAYIRAVVRNGMNGMLAFRKVELSDADVDAIIVYLTNQP